MKEIWKEVVGYEGYYQVSNKGNVRSVDLIVYDKNNVGRFHKGRLLKIYKNPKGYSSLTLCVNQVKKCQNVHRLVAEAFIPNPNNLPQINHKDENPHNNKVDNLEWCDQKYNNNYGGHNKKISQSIINKIYNQRPIVCIDTGIRYCSCYDASRKTGLSVSCIRRACEGITKQAGGHKWKYIT